MSANIDSETKIAPTAWLLLCLAVSFEIGGAIGLRFSQGFTLLVPTARLRRFSGRPVGSDPT